MNRLIFKQFHNDGAISVQGANLREAVDFLRHQCSMLYGGRVPVRPWDIRELHNPWGRAAAKLDRWRFLDLCQSPALLDIVSQLIGPDVILYDSQFVSHTVAADPTAQDAETDHLMFPVEPAAGVTVRLPFRAPGSEPARFVFARASHSPGDLKFDTVHLSMTVGRLIFHDPGVKYRIVHPGADCTPFEYVIRYFPATSRYIRDPSAPKQLQLMERLPLINFSKLPLWLVLGEDKAGNDFVTGFHSKPPRWTGEPSC